MKTAAARSAAGEVLAAGLAHRSGDHWVTDSRTLVAHLLSTMEPDRRETLHGKAAEMLESSTDPQIDPWLLSRLWSRAGKRQLAIAYAIRAAERSQAENDPAEAAARYGQALRLMGRGEQRLAIRLKQAEALTGAGMHQRAARACGAGPLRIMVRHLIPNALGPVLVNATFGVAGAILVESALSFLGFGTPPPTASWGEVLAQAYEHQGRWWLTLCPGALLFLTVSALNLLGEGLRDAVDPLGRDW